LHSRKLGRRNPEAAPIEGLGSTREWKALERFLLMIALKGVVQERSRYEKGKFIQNAKPRFR